MSCNADCMDQKDYDIGMCGCFQDLKACLCAFCLAPYAVGYYVGESEGTSFSIPSCLFAPLGLYRLRRNNIANHKEKQSKDGSIMGVAFCTFCSLVQDIHEVRHQKKVKRYQAPPPMMMPMSPHGIPPGSPVMVAPNYHSPHYSPPHSPHYSRPHSPHHIPPSYPSSHGNQ